MLTLDVVNIPFYIKANNVKEVTSPYILGSDGSPDPEGIFSYDIFGVPGTRERGEYFGYIDLKRKFIHPMIYNAIQQMFRALPEVIRGERFVKVAPNGSIVTVKEDDKDGETGVDFFIDNWDKIIWTATGSTSREKKENLFSMIPKDRIFIDKWLILPALYRDINLHDREQKGKIDMDESNSLYIRLINLVSSASLTFTSSYLTQSSAQSVLVEIHDLFTTKPAGKNGVIRKHIMGKTVDYAIISVISAPRFNANSIEDQMVPYNYVGAPLPSLCSLFYPLVVKGLEDFFHDTMQSTEIILNNKPVDIDDEIRMQLDSDSLKELVRMYVTDRTKKFRTSRFSLGGESGTRFSAQEAKLGRPFTITDLLFGIVADVVDSRHILSSRYPLTDSGSTIFNKIKILTTEETIDMSNNAKEISPLGKDSFMHKHFSRYPKFPVNAKGEIDHEKTRWIDTIVPNNAFLAALGGDFDTKISLSSMAF